MKFAILFWFYKEPEICLNRLQLIKKYNPNTKIFGLFGGDINKAKGYKNKLKEYLDDFFVTTLHNKPRDWKWINGDLMILNWYTERGKNLNDWDSIAIVQWDALILGNIKSQFSGIKKGEIFISGTRILDINIEKKWNWTKKGTKERKNYLKFKDYVLNHYGYKNKLLCSLFIFQVFPKIFFEKWLTVEDKEIGMLEYKIPTYAKIFKINFYKNNLDVWWFNQKTIKGETALNARGIEVTKDYIKKQLKNRKGFRIFHPYFKKWDD